MTQDLFDWLNSGHKDEAGHEGLLLVPVMPAQPQLPPPEPEPSPEPQPEPEAEPPAPEPEAPQARITALNDAWQTVNEPEEEREDDILFDSWPAPQEEPETTDTITEPEDIPQESEEVPETPETPESEPTPPEPEEQEEDEPENWQGSSEPLDAEQHSSILNQAWHEASSLNINLDEPPQEMWTDISSDDEDDEERGYIENPSLQGDAYIPVPKHGANFTQRLQATLQSRKERAAKAREQDSENNPSYHYFQKALIFCGVLLMTLGFAYLGLWFIERETPEGLNARASSLYASGRYDEAAQLYQRGSRRYPHILTFMTGLAKSAEKAGMTQTAIAAWNEYAASLPEGDTEHRDEARAELERLIPGGRRDDAEPKPQPQPVKDEPQRITLPEVRPMTFDEAMSEANHAFNIGMYSRALANFHKAHAIRENDIRPYIGLAASYRAKGMFFDAKRMLDEARKKFGRVPALEVEMTFLKGE